MSVLNTQLGYRPQRSPGVRGTGGPPRLSSGVTRALANVAPAAPAYRSPYADPTGTLFPGTDMPSVQSQAPASTPSAYAQQKPVAPQAPAGFSFDLETDPVLQQMHAMAAKQRQDAEAGALAQRKQLAIQYGDQGYGNSIDANTGQAAAQNPFSVTANLANEYQTGTHNLEEDLNQHNLFYSGARINELANALHDYQRQQASAAGAFQSALGNVDQNRIASLIGADQSEQGGYNDAYSRALAYALANQTTPPPAPTGPTNAAGVPQNTSYADLGIEPGPTVGPGGGGGTVGYRPTPTQPPADPIANVDLTSLLASLRQQLHPGGAPVTSSGIRPR